jgi:hypothetical protein
MGGVDLSEVMRQTINDPILLKSSEVLLGREPGEHAGEKRFDVLWQDEDVGLGDRDKCGSRRPRGRVCPDRRTGPQSLAAARPRARIRRRAVMRRGSTLRRRRRA